MSQFQSYTKQNRGQNNRNNSGYNNDNYGGNYNDRLPTNRTLKIPPQSMESEMALLGSVMMRAEVMYDIGDMIKSETFYSEKHKRIWETMRELFEKGNPIDLLTLSERLREKELLDTIGGVSFLTELINTVPSSSNAVHYAEVVQKKYLMRQLIEASEHVGALGYEESSDIETLLDQAEKKIFEVTNFSGSAKFTALKDVLGDAWDRLDHLHRNQDEIRGIPTGFDALDNKLAGLQKSDLIILAARPSMGKTSLALDIARNAAIRHGKSVGIFSLEMSTQQLVDRMIAAESRVDAWKLRTGKLSLDNEFNKIRDSLEPLSKAPIYVDDQPGNNILKMRSVARRLKSEKGLDMIIVDYLQLIVPTQSKNSDNVVQQITEISRALKNLAREMDVPVLALSQLSRAVEQRGGKPRLSDLRDSGSIEQDADVVMFIHREDKYKDNPERPNVADILIEKHRNGPTGSAELYFDADKSTFLPLEKSNYGSFQKDINDF